MTERTDEEERHELYVKYYEALEKIKLSNSEAFDKAILTLSSAGLALSLTFFKFVAPIDQASNLGCLVFSWYAFLTAIISTVISFRVAQRGYDVAIEYAEKFYLEGKEEYEGKHNAPAAFAEFLNWISAIAFVLALISIVKFVTQNIG